MEPKNGYIKFERHIPSWVKGLIGSFVALILIPSISIIGIIKLGGIEDIMQSWAKQQLKISEPVVQSNKDLAIQMLQLNSTMLEFKHEINKNTQILDSRLSAVENTLTIHSAQIESGLQALQKIQGWAIEHSENESVDYEP